MGQDVEGETLGARLREARRRAVLTQDELAGRARVSPREIRLLESGTTLRPRPRTLRALARALGLQVERLVV